MKIFNDFPPFCDLGQTPQELAKERKHQRDSLKACGHPNWSHNSYLLSTMLSFHPFPKDLTTVMKMLTETHKVSSTGSENFIVSAQKHQQHGSIALKVLHAAQEHRTAPILDIIIMSACCITYINRCSSAKTAVYTGKTSIITSCVRCRPSRWAHCAAQHLLGTNILFSYFCHMQ